MPAKGGERGNMMHAADIVHVGVGCWYKLWYKEEQQCNAA
jgi:hypothetical protein